MMPNIIAFTDTQNKQLIIQTVKRGIEIFFDENDFTTQEQKKLNRINYSFTRQHISKIYEQLFETAKKLYPTLQLKEVTNLQTDYAEYYDKEFDNNGGAGIHVNSKENSIILNFDVPAYHLGSQRLFRFTRAKIETYLYDLRAAISQLSTSHVHYTKVKLIAY